MDIIEPSSTTDGNTVYDHSGAVPFNVLIPRPFRLSEQPKEHLDKIRDEVMDKEKTWENRMTMLGFFQGYSIISDSWRIRPNDSGISLSSKKGQSPKTMFQSKSGETHRATECLATFWFRQLTGATPNFDVSRMGLNQNGQPATEDDLYAVQGVILEQQRASNFYKKLMRSERSKALFGCAVAEEPFVSKPYGFGQKYIEYTDWVFRPMIRTGFDTTAIDIMESDFIFFIDFVSKWNVLNQSSQDAEYWDRAKVESHIKEYVKGAPSGKTDIYSRVQASKSRAGYSNEDAGIYEMLNYHGRLEPENPVVQAFAESVGVDPQFVDWSVGILDGDPVVKFHMTQYGDWRTRAKVLSYKDFEDESLPYGVGQLGRKLQRMLDIVESLADDKATFDILNMWKRGAYAGNDAKEFVAEPLKVVDVEDVAQLVPLVGDPQVLKEVLQMVGLRREDFRDNVGAKTNLQGEAKGVSATESAIAQNESVRAAGVSGQLDAEVLREHLNISHINNLNYLDEEIWVGMTGKRPPVPIKKDRLPIGVGFSWKVVTDSDFRPEERRDILQALQIGSSLKGNFPPEIVLNMITELSKVLFRKFGLDPALLSQPVPQAQLMEMRLNRALSSGGLQNELKGEQAGDGEMDKGMMNTPVGPVPTSPDAGQGLTEASA